jgi:F0F1-type ATP synthase membrane subunit b/b'
METISFLLGVAAVITLVIVVVTFMNYVTIKNLIKDIRNLEEADQKIMRSVDQSERNSIEYSSQLDNNIQLQLEALNRHIDSRVDKCEEKTKNQLKDLTSTKSN